MKTQRSRVSRLASVSYTQCPAVATRLRYFAWIDDAEHQYGLPLTRKNTLPMVRGRLTFFTLVGVTFSWPIGGTTPVLPLGAASLPPNLTLPLTEESLE
ncbi:hypothetical protein GCM10007964_68700 [Sphaerisporangium melleum]|uniref:Uncharacterized protein n=1 Tax=Sphaerisporangium melleum TaxID=321316 RepID=A0A917VV29_9ACTN|nr:hypothetical protein GCM10007964_68700 [Sphaerisporangium melleum]